MKEFRCLECGCNFRIPFGEGYPDGQQSCPNCKSLDILRINRKLTWGERHQANKYRQLQPYIKVKSHELYR